MVYNVESERGEKDMDPDILMAMLGDLSMKLDTVIGLLTQIESNTSGTESNTDDLSYIKGDISDIYETIKEINGIE